jgi:hypothetical protein
LCDQPREAFGHRVWVQRLAVFVGEYQPVVDNSRRFVSGAAAPDLRPPGRPGRPQQTVPAARTWEGRGKKERFYRTVAEQFAVEIDVGGVATLAELGRWWAGWVEQVYHHRVHRGTGQTPHQRWTAGAHHVLAALTRPP